MNCKIKRKSWRRLAAALLAGLCLLTGSGAALAAQAAGVTATEATTSETVQAAPGDTTAATAATPETAQTAPGSEAAATPESATSPDEEPGASTPETAASAAQFSFTVLDSDYQAPASGNIDESLFSIEADEARMPSGEAVPVLLQVVDPAPDSTVTVTLSDGAVFTDSEMETDDGSTYTRTFASGEQASAWMLYVRADGDFTAEATYAGLNGESLTRTISVTRYHKISLFSAFSARAGEHQYHITDVTNVGGEWLERWEKEYAPQTPEETWNPLFVEALQKKPYIEYLLDIFLSGSMEERASVVAEYGKEVRKIEQRISEFTASHPAGRHERSRSLSAGAER